MDELRDEISAFYINDKIYVYSTICPHNGGEFRLEDNGKELRCLWHGWKFNAETGKSITKLENYKKNSFIYKILKKEEKPMGCFPFDGELSKYNFEVKDKILKIVIHENS